MLKFVKHTLENIDGVAIYPMISLLIFFIFFVVLFYKVFRASKSFIHEMSHLPIDESKKSNEL